jgi:hypothetical protein
MSDKFEGLPVIDADEAEQITAAVRIEDIQEGDPNDPVQHPIAIALRRQGDIDDARITKSETLIRRGKAMVPLRPARQDVVQAFAEDADGIAGLGSRRHRAGVKP